MDFLSLKLLLLVLLPSILLANGNFLTFFQHSIFSLNSFLKSWFLILIDTCLQDNVDYAGNDFHQVIVPTALECQQKCKEDKRCKFFTYSKSAKKCYLKHSKATPSAVQNVISGPEVCCFAHKIDYMGNDIRQVQTSNDIECQKACQNEPNCKYWTLLVSRKKCHLKSAKEIGSTNHEDLISGPKTCPGMHHFWVNQKIVIVKK